LIKKRNEVAKVSGEKPIDIAPVIAAIPPRSKEDVGIAKIELTSQSIACQTLPVFFGKVKKTVPLKSLSLTEVS
jgi:hypothetical protein